MRPLASLGRDEARGLTGLLFDLDDTVLTHGLLERAAFGALWDLHDAGLKLVAVTGRPSGWAEVLVRQWPIDGAVTENGAVFVVREGRGARVILDEPRVAGEPSPARDARLEALVAEVRAAMPAIELADDVGGRRSDVAWDIGERAKVPEADVAALARRVVGAGARTTRSSVHLHATFARDDKASGATRFLRERFGEDPGRSLARWAFVGDSANDAACFAAFRTTFGVANVRAFLAKLSVPPRFVARAERGEGFAEIARTLIALRA
ncbi:MAG: HAD-IIB family hydrolase [Labilithrix sp.]|nr:HAD-IIB family hydrolase [Labilithrix sp.]MBX3225004.1 HAD-IIB family hydrolase [Labilithrix sp.]